MEKKFFASRFLKVQKIIFVVAMQFAICFTISPFCFSQDKTSLDNKADEAILKATEFLINGCKRDGSWINGPKKEGTTALVIYTLIRCKERLGKDRQKEIDEIIDKGIKRISDYIFSPTEADEQYTMALSIMALEAHDKRKHAAKITELVNLLVHRQDDSGGWGYCKTEDKFRIRPDVSITQYVILGLFAANHGGIKVDDKVFRKALKWVLKAQFENGTWVCCSEGGGLHVDGSANDSCKKSKGINLNMTAAGLGTILICEYILGKNLGDVKPEELKTAIKKAEDVLKDHWKDGKQESKGHDYQHFYYLYGIERAFTLLGREKIGKDDWYYMGAEKFVLPLQSQEGSFEHKETWNLTNHKVLQTSFALLFLSRATEAFFTQN